MAVASRLATRSSAKRAAVYRRRRSVRAWSRTVSMLALELTVYSAAAWWTWHVWGHR